VVSAHRSPDRAAEYVKTAVSRGLKVIIAGAGGAAHLAGVMAAGTALPVIGVPIESGALKGLDALLATIQMPPGIPVATVAINGAKNAGILAMEMLALGDEQLSSKLIEHKKKLADGVVAKAQKLESEGFKKYLEK
jgi:5-(carboxyamino)imidazole ribonucleotide mutase